MPIFNLPEAANFLSVNGKSGISAITGGKCNLQEATSGGSSAAHESKALAEGIERVPKRVDIMSMLPEDEVAKVRNVFTPAEILEWKVKKATEHVLRVPALQAYTVKPRE